MLILQACFESLATAIRQAIEHACLNDNNAAALATADHEEEEATKPAKEQNTHERKGAATEPDIAEQFRRAVRKSYASASAAYDAFRGDERSISRAGFMRALKSVGMGSVGKEERRMLRKLLARGKQISRRA